ncbi:hypothetical protein CPB84DRAFT_1675500 [Gymnopilus junonius]|uniref:DUF3533 domain-containing protein n=1 Tax=Gymnopilus junonius TaxID=109634 RepID=A0A9P5TR32_GYMJU|nr:hypothetical protein CPB84DRAFT_1675500 [Gymnopilus junonius]
MSIEKIDSDVKATVSGSGSETLTSSERSSQVVHLLYSTQFTHKSSAIAKARWIYAKILFQRTCLIVAAIFAIFSIYWGALWRLPARSLEGWIVDFDGGQIGQFVAQRLSNDITSAHIVNWHVQQAQEFPDGLKSLVAALLDEKCWVAIAINLNATRGLNERLTGTNPSVFNASTAITAYGLEARNENAFTYLRKITSLLDQITHDFAVKLWVDAIQSNGSIAAVPPEILTRPIYFTLENLRPFDAPVATAVTFIGLIYLLILSFMVLAYTTLTSAFKLPFDRHFGRGGFVLFWMLSWFGMTAAGLALEAMMTLLTIKYIQVFMILWVIGNVSVCLWPIDALPYIYNYGHAAPFYQISRGVRSILFGTKNELGQNFGILSVWIVVSCISLPLIQWYRRRGEIAAWKATLTKSV